MSLMSQLHSTGRFLIVGRSDRKGQASRAGVSRAGAALPGSDRLQAGSGGDGSPWASQPHFLRFCRVCVCAAAAGLGQEAKPACSGRVGLTGSAASNPSLGSSPTVNEQQ